LRECLAGEKKGSDEYGVLLQSRTTAQYPRPPRGQRGAVSDDRLEIVATHTWSEKVYRKRLSTKFKCHLNGKRVICLDIPDEYGYMQTEHVQILQLGAIPASASCISSVHLKR
jgi:hypothetical protein